VYSIWGKGGGRISLFFGDRPTKSPIVPKKEIIKTFLFWDELI
jgi:hypothetical protein